MVKCNGNSSMCSGNVMKRKTPNGREVFLCQYHFEQAFNACSNSRDWNSEEEKEYEKNEKERLSKCHQCKTKIKGNYLQGDVWVNNLEKRKASFCSRRCYEELVEERKKEQERNALKLIENEKNKN